MTHTELLGIMAAIIDSGPAGCRGETMTVPASVDRAFTMLKLIESKSEPPKRYPQDYPDFPKFPDEPEESKS